ncbi:MAG: lytic transglycosylase domain-containing protein [Bacillota bacterium]
MDMELMVRLMQMQMLTNPQGSQKRSRGVGGPNFALLLAALMDSPATNAGMKPFQKASAGKSGNSVTAAEAGSGRGLKPGGGRNYKKVNSSGIESLAERTAAKHGLDPALLMAVIKVESDFNPLAVSSAGATGLMQLMPETAASLGVKNPYDPLENLEGGARYLKSLMDRFGDVNLALAAYNAGPGAVEEYGGVPPYSETIYYLEKINRILGR